MPIGPRSVCYHAGMRTTLAILALSLAAPALGVGPTPADKVQILEAVSRGSTPELNRAIDRLRYLGQPREILNAIARVLSEGEPLARQNAAQVFAIVPDKNFSQALLHALHDSDVVVRERACVGLGKMKSRDAVKSLAALTDDSSPVLRRESARALGRIGDKAALPALLPLLEDHEPEPRQVAIWALGELGDPKAGAPLLPLLKDPSESIRLAATASLCRLGNAEGRKVAEGLLASAEAYERRDAVQLLTDVRAPWVKQALAGLLKDKDFAVRLAAAKVLAVQGDGRGVEWLVWTAESGDAEEAMRIESALEELGVSSADRKKILAGRPKP